MSKQTIYFCGSNHLAVLIVASLYLQRLPNTAIPTFKELEKVLDLWCSTRGLLGYPVFCGETKKGERIHTLFLDQDRQIVFQTLTCLEREYPQLCSFFFIPVITKINFLPNGLTKKFTSFFYNSTFSKKRIYRQIQKNYWLLVALIKKWQEGIIWQKDE